MVIYPIKQQQHMSACVGNVVEQDRTRKALGRSSSPHAHRCIASCRTVCIIEFDPCRLPVPSIENAVMAVRQISTSRMLEMAVLGNILSIAFFNYFGISVTQSMSATHRMVLDSIRTMVIWVFSLAVGWQSFAALQVVGFTILLFGTLVYNELLVVPGFSTGGEHGGLIEALVDEEETDRLLPENRGIN